MMNLCGVDDGVFLDVNDAFLSTFGLAREDVIGRAAPDLDIWNDPEEWCRLKEKLAKPGFLRHEEVTFQNTMGHAITGLVSADVINVAGKPYLLSVTRDITARKAAERLFDDVNQAMTCSAIPSRRHCSAR
jgi:PAS domain S-box-containing protein